MTARSTVQTNIRAHFTPSTRRSTLRALRPRQRALESSKLRCFGYAYGAGPSMYARVFLVVFSLSTGALAAPPRERAAELYDQGAAAYDAGDYDRALHALREADALAPNDVVLELALKAALQSTQPVTAMDTAERAELRGGKFPELRRIVRDRFARQVGRVRIVCRACRPSLDGAPTAPGVTRFVSLGQHEVRATSGGRERTYSVRVAADTVSELRIDEAPAADRGTLATPQRRDGVSPVWFWLGVGVTAAVAGGTALSALDTRNRHETFQRTPSAPNAEAGKSSQRRTNWLAAGTALSAVGTAVIGIVVVDWGGTRERGAP